MLQAGAHARARTRRREPCGGGGGDANLAARGQALAGVKILQDVQEELAQKPVLLRGEKEGLVRIIFGLEAVLRVVPLEVEQAACNLGKKCASQDHVIMIARQQVRIMSSQVRIMSS